MAHHGQPLPRDGGLLRRRESRRAPRGSRFPWVEERLRLRCTLPRTLRHAAARRSCEEPRRSEVYPRDAPDILRLPAMSISSFASSARRAARLILAVAALGLC